jgi:TPR repeat protein
MTYLHEEVRMATQQKQAPIAADISLHGSLGGFFFLNRQRQVARGSTKEWNPYGHSSFGIKPEQQLVEAKRLYEAQQYAEAKTLFEEAASGGHVEAPLYLGWLYDSGEGVQQDYATARQWYEKAAAAGDGDAMFALGQLYERGRGVRRDHATARQWYKKAAAAGSEAAKKHLRNLSQ